MTALAISIVSLQHRIRRTAGARTRFSRHAARRAEGPICVNRCRATPSGVGPVIRDLRSLLAGMRLAKQTAVHTAVRLITTGILLALMAGIAIKLKLFGKGP